MRACSQCHLLLADSNTVCPHDGAATSPATVPPVPASLLVKLTDPQPYAQGLTGTCYLATQKQSGYAGLLKIIPLGRVEAAERVRLKRELRKQTRLQHEGLARIFDGGEVGADLWLFRELVAGETLAQRIRRSGKLPLPEALAITAQVSSALDELQRNGLLHRDIKPSHIVLETRASGLPMARLIDAGVAARVQAGAVFDLLGTLAYISPEQVAGKLVSFRSDLYALGCVLFEMLAGTPPFTGEVKAVLEAHKSSPPPALEIPLPANIQALLRSLLAKEPRQRPFSAQQVRRTLEPQLPEGTPLPVVTVRAPSMSKSMAPPPPRRASNPDFVEDAPDDLVLDEIDAGSTGQPTLQLDTGEVDALEIRVGSEADRATQPLDSDELDFRRSSASHATMSLRPEDLMMGSGELSIPPIEIAASIPAAALASPFKVEPSARDTEVTVVGPAPSRPSAAAAVSVGPAPSPPSAAAALSASESVPARPSRRSVDFDVESLFEDEVPSEPLPPTPTSVHEDAPTQLFRPAVPRPDPMLSSLDEPVHPDPDGTVVVARPAPPKGPPWFWIGAVAIAVIALVVLLRSRKTDEPPAADANPPATAKAPVAPVAVTGAEPPALAHPAATALPSSQPEAAKPPAAASEAAKPEPPAPETEKPAAPGQAPNQVSPGATLSANAAAPVPTAPAVPPAQPAPGSEAPAAAAPGTEPNVQPPAPPVGVPPGSKLSPQRDPRAERLEKAEALKAEARAHYQAARYREAAAAYAKAVSLNPQDAAGYAGLGASQLAAKNASAAVDAYSRAVSLQPTSSGFHAALGRAYLQRGDRGRARAAYEKSLQLNPDNGAARTALEQLK